MEIMPLGTATSACKTEHRGCNEDTQPQYMNRYKKGKKLAMLLWPCYLLSCIGVWMRIWKIFTMPFSKYYSRQYLRVYQLWNSTIYSLWNNVFCSHWRAFIKKIFNLCKQFFYPFDSHERKTASEIWLNPEGGELGGSQNTMRLLEQINFWCKSTVLKTTC